MHRTRYLPTLLLWSITVWLAGAAVAAPQQAPPGLAGRDGRTVTIVYDARDLARAPRAEDPDPSAESGLSGAALLPATRPSRRPTIEQVIDRIRTQVAAGSWDETLPPTDRSTLRELNGNLIITARPAHHEAIAAMLAELRAEVSLTVLIECLIVDEGDLPLPLEVALEPHEGADGNAWLGAIVTADEIDAIETWSQQRAPDAIVAAPRLLVLDGQSASVVVSSDDAIVLPIAGAMGRTTTVRPLDGAALWARPEISDDRRGVTLAVNPRRARLERGERVHETSATSAAVVSVPDGSGLVMRLDLETTHLVAARLDHRGGLVAFDREPCPDPSSPRTVLILVEPRIVIVDES